MYKEIKIGGITVPMLANGATPLRYKLVFGKDLMTEFQGAMNDSSKAMDSLPELAFIMAKAAEAKDGKADMNCLNQDIYLDWLERFEPMDIPMASEEIVNLYSGNMETKSEAKKKEKKNRA